VKNNKLYDSNFPVLIQNKLKETGYGINKTGMELGIIPLRQTIELAQLR
jgi:hypothetical protein